MKKLFSILILFVAFTAAAQLPPLLRTPATTNFYGTVFHATNQFFGIQSALLSRGLLIPAQAYEYIPALGSVDLQPNTDSATTNLYTGITCSVSAIGGGFGNIISNSTLDSTFSGGVIGGGILNVMINPVNTVIGGGENNYAGPESSFTFSDNTHACVIAGGAGNYIYDGHHATISGGNGNVNRSTTGAIGGGQQNTLSTSTAAFIAGGEQNRMSLSSYSFIGAGTFNSISSAEGAAILGNYITNTEPYSVKMGYRTNAVMVSSNGQFRIPANTTLHRAATGNEGWFWNSNKVLYFVTSTKTNLISDGQ